MSVLWFNFIVFDLSDYNGLPDVIPLFISESQSYSGAVSCLFSYIHSVTSCRINFLPSTNGQQFVLDKSSNSVIVILLSKDMHVLLRQSHFICPKEAHPETEEIRNILDKIKGKEFKKVIVTFKPVAAELNLFKDTQIFDLSVYNRSETRGDFSMNLSQILKTITGNEELPMNWCSKEQILDLQEKITNIPLSDLVDPVDNILDLAIQAPGLYNCMRNCPIPISGNCQQACSDCLERYKFGYNTDARNGKAYYTDFSDEGFYSRDAKDVMTELQHGVFPRDGCGHFNECVGIEDFVPQAPDSDTESDSFSVLVRRKEEINKNYMTELKDEKSQGKNQHSKI